jgi:hypothetical protein
MDINAIGMPTSRPVQAQSSTPAPEHSEVPGAKNYEGSTADLAKVNTAKSALPEGVGDKLDKTA